MVEGQFGDQLSRSVYLLLHYVIKIIADVACTVVEEFNTNIK